MIGLFTLRNTNGLEAEITNYGGIVRALRVPDRQGRFADVVLGFDAVESYYGAHPYFGALIGRHANRIAEGRFRLDGRSHQLALNEGRHHLHGGGRGFDRAVWAPETRKTAEGSALVLRHTSADGEEGYPGTLACEVTYTLTESNELRVDYQATVDRPTIVNLTQHSYFNLTGQPGADILGHHLRVDADAFLPVTPELIPTGERRSVAGTPFDLRASRIIGECLREDEPQLAIGHGYDHCFELRSTPAGSGAARRAAALYEPLSGRLMEVFTTEPGLQVYTGGGLDGTLSGKGGDGYRAHAGVCLETQHFPDSVNHGGFPSVRLDRGETYRSATVFRFSTAP